MVDFSSFVLSALIEILLFFNDGFENEYLCTRYGNNKTH